MLTANCVSARSLLIMWFVKNSTKLKRKDDVLNGRSSSVREIFCDRRVVISKYISVRVAFCGKGDASLDLGGYPYIGEETFVENFSDYPDHRRWANPFRIGSKP